MKRIISWIAILCVLIAVIAGATVLYNKFGGDFTGGNLQSVNPTESDKASNNSQASEDDTDSSVEKGEDAVKNTAPDFKVLNAEGEAVNLSDYFGRPIVVNFWATWCGYCKKEMPDFDKAAKEYSDVLFMMVNVGESIETGTKYAKGQGFDLDLFFDMDHSAADVYGVTGYPTTFFINADGNLVKYAKGRLSYDTLLNGIKTITN